MLMLECRGGFRLVNRCFYAVLFQGLRVRPQERFGRRMVTNTAALANTWVVWRALLVLSECVCCLMMVMAIVCVYFSFTDIHVESFLDNRSVSFLLSRRPLATFPQTFLSPASPARPPPLRITSAMPQTFAPALTPTTRPCSTAHIIHTHHPGPDENLYTATKF